MLQKRNPNERGSVLLLVLVVSVVFLTVIGLYTEKMMTYSNLQGRSEVWNQSLHLAESGIEDGVHALNRGQWGTWVSSGNSRFKSTSLHDHIGDQVGEYNILIDDISSANPLITATGITRSGQEVVRTVSVRVRQQNQPSRYDWGIYGYNWLSFQSDYRMDSYNSANGPYPGWGNGNSNGNIGGYNVTDAKFGSDGDVYGGLQGNIQDYDNSDTTIHGNDNDDPAVILNSQGTPPPPFPDDELDAARAAKAGSSGYPNVTFWRLNDSSNPSSNREWKSGPSLKVGSDVIIRIPPGVYYLTYLELGSNVQIEVEGEGKVQLFLEGSKSDDPVFKTGSNVGINGPIPDPNDFDGVNPSSTSGTPPSTRPGNFEILVKRGEVEFGSDSLFVGTIFAPFSEVSLGSNNHIFGAVVAKEWDIQSNSYFHYDESLGQPSVQGGVLVTQWNELTDPDNHLR